MPKLSSLPRKNGKVFYRGRTWKLDKPVRSYRKGKKMMVLARKGDEVQLVHFGDSSMRDYTQHENKDRRANYLARSAGIKNKDGKPTKDDPFSPNYWSRKHLWAARKDSKMDKAALLERIDSLRDRFDSRKERQRRKTKQVFDEWKSGELNIGKSSKKVPRSKRGHKQAIAIALSEAEKVGRKDALLERLDSIRERYDRAGAGVPCGNSWIPRTKKCSKEKARTTSAEARQRGAQKAREYNKLRAEVARDKGKKARNLNQYEAREKKGQLALDLSPNANNLENQLTNELNKRELRHIAESFGNDQEFDDQERLARARLRRLQAKNKHEAKKTEGIERTLGEPKTSKAKKRKELEESGRELESLFIRSERVGNKYQSKAERDRFQQQLASEAEAISEATDKQLKDDVLEVVDYSQRKQAQRAIAADKVRKALPNNPGTRIPGKAGEIFARAEARRKAKAEPEAESVVAEVVEPKPKRSKAGDKVRAIAQELRSASADEKKALGGIVGASAQLAGLQDKLIDEMAEAAYEDLGEARDPVASAGDRAYTSTPKAPKQKRKGLANQLRDTAETLKEEGTESNKATARVLGAAAAIAQNNDKLIAEAVEMAEEDLAKPKRKKKSLSDRISDAPQRTPRKPKTIKGVSIDSANSIRERLDSLKRRAMEARASV